MKKSNNIYLLNIIYREILNKIIKIDFFCEHISSIFIRVFLLWENLTSLHFEAYITFGMK